MSRTPLPLRPSRLPATDSGTLTVVAGAATKLAITTAPQTLTAGVTSGTITVQIQDVAGNPVSPGVARTNTLSSTSASGVFRNMADTVTITSITNAGGAPPTQFLDNGALGGGPPPPRR